MKPILTPEMKNTWDILDMIENATPETTRAAIAKKLDKSRTTVSNIVNQLMSMNFVEELESAAKGRGRPGIPLTLTQSTWFSLGASFHGGEWHFVLTNLAGIIIREHKETVVDDSVQNFIEALLVGIEYMISLVPGKLIPLIGVGTPGLVNSDTGVIVRADDMGWKKVDVYTPVLKKFNIPPFVINRHRAAGLGEARFGSGKGISSLIYIGIGNGISAAFINDGILLEGANFSAGEIGHMLIDPDGPLCGCGRYGCLQAYSSGVALVRILKEKYSSQKALGDDLPSNVLWSAIEDRSLTAELIVKEADCGNEIAITCLEKISVQLGIAVSNLINTLNPQKIIIGGTLSNHGTLLTNLIQKEAARRAMPSPFSSVQIEKSSLGYKAGALGAATMPLRHKLELILPLTNLS
jgi:predicted NBD/HSP70 family sugar kinase